MKPFVPIPQQTAFASFFPARRTLLEGLPILITGESVSNFGRVNDPHMGAYFCPEIIQLDLR
jgi:hypothetical protein